MVKVHNMKCLSMKTNILRIYNLINLSFRRALKEENNQFIFILKYLLEGIFLLKVQTILKLFVHTNNVLIGAIGVDGICLESKKKNIRGNSFL